MPQKKEKQERQENTNISERRDQVIKRMLSTPPKEHAKPEPGRKPGRPIASPSSASETSD